ncbi:hypothetical protein EN829_055930, partial [Mesorhizobium sp. M00.F.Ca.ET.186.01.1.1]
GRSWMGTAFGGARGRTDVPKIVDWYMDGKIEIDTRTAASQLQPNLSRKNEPEKWLYRPVWKQYNGSGRTRTDDEQFDTYLLFIDTDGIGEAVKQALQAKGKRVCTVKAGQHFSKLDPNAYEIHPEETEQYLALLREVFTPGQTWKIVHLWSLASECADASPAAGTSVFYRLLHLGQSFGMLDPQQQIQLFVIASASQSITGNEALLPQQAMALGAAQVLTQEFGNVRSAFLEIEPEQFVKQGQPGMKLLVEELLKQEPENLLAIRNRHKWVRTYEPLRLDPPTTAQPEAGGVHLILGGLGGIGLTAAGALAQHGPATIILTG